MRDNFSEATKKLLADRAGRKCSNPYCRRTTIGPQLGDKGTVNIGEAAHISIMKKLMHFKDAVSKGKNRERAREQQKDRGQSL